MVHRDVAPLIRVPFQQRKVHDPRERVLIRVEESRFLRDVQAELAQQFRGRVCFSRGHQQSPNFALSSDQGATWTYGGQLTTFNQDVASPARFAAGEEGNAEIVPLIGQLKVVDNR